MRQAVLIAVGTAIQIAAVSGQAAPPERDWFEQHFITRSMPNPVDWGYGTPALADFDRDGDLDFAFGVRESSIYWFEFQAADSWVRRRLGSSHIRNLGAATMDVDGDGWTDVVTGGYWYQNPRAPRDKAFTEHLYDPTIEQPMHDVAVADINQDGRDDVVVLGDGVGCFWYSIPPGQETSRWQRVTITLRVLTSQDSIHSGFSPRGIDDLDGDGDVDVVLPDRWLENQQRGQKWSPHSLEFGKRGPWGLSSRSWIVDLDRDGDKDIVIVDSDQQQSRAAWLESDGAKPPSFTRHWLPLTAPGQRGSFHSLAVADFDGDGDDDIFTAEQEDGTIPPEGASPRWYVWENLGGGREFAERIVFDGRLGGHDVIVGDVDGDGDPDICTKIWKRWAGNANGGREHASFLENLTIDQASREEKPPLDLSGTWVETPWGQPVIDRGQEGEWDHYAVDNPYVHVDGQKFYCFFEAQDRTIAQGGHEAFGLAVSSGGHQWRKLPGNPILSVGQAGAWDGVVAKLPAGVVKRNGLYHLFYSGRSSNTKQIGLATAREITGPWSKFPGNPVLASRADQWDAFISTYPAPIFESNGKYYLLFRGMKQRYRGQGAGLAESTDLRRWRRLAEDPVIPVTEEMASLAVTRVGEQYVGISQPADLAQRRYWFSRNLTSWSKGPAVNFRASIAAETISNPFLANGEWTVLYEQRDRIYRAVLRD